MTLNFIFYQHPFFYKLLYIVTVRAVSVVALAGCLPWIFDLIWFHLDVIPMSSFFFFFTDSNVEWLWFDCCDNFFYLILCWESTYIKATDAVHHHAVALVYILYIDRVHAEHWLMNAALINDVSSSSNVFSLMDRILYSPSARPTVIFTAHIDPYNILHTLTEAKTVHVFFLSPFFWETFEWRIKVD